jgi:methyltransferase-like protein/SAM-dependent methyltransferase
MADTIRSGPSARQAEAPTSYDAVPYQSLAYAQTHPDRLATMARIFGVPSPDVTRCRLLELGCASGGNLIPMAFNFPDSTFVGIDLSRRQIEEGHGVIRALGLRNITVEHASILDVDEAWGDFDYIICHGVFSWVEQPVQDKIFEIARDRLTASGVAYVSYNTYPGWHMREMVRHMMRYHAGRFDESAEQINQARALLDFLAASVAPDDGAYGQLLTGELERIRQATDSYLFHEQLEQNNRPLYFYQFIERAERFGLRYLSEASISDMLPGAFPTPIAETLERISPDILHLEQYMDFVRNRQFRQTLLCHRGQQPRRALRPALLHDLLVSCSAVVDPSTMDLSRGTAMVFTKGTQTATATLPASKAALMVLTEHWPEVMRIDELCAAALDRAALHLGDTSAEEAREHILGDLLRCLLHGVIGAHTHAPQCVRTVSDTPCGHPFAIWQASRGEPVVNAHHEMFQFEPLSIEVLKLANGQRSRRDILEALVEGFERSGVVLQENGAPVTDLTAARTMFAERLDATLADLARSAVLIAGRP